MSNYGFGDTKSAISLPTQSAKKAKPTDALVQAVEAGKKLGFVSREGQGRRKPGPKRKEPQGKLTLTGPKRILDDLQAHCDAMGGVAYWEAIEDLLSRR